MKTGVQRICNYLKRLDSGLRDCVTIRHPPPEEVGDPELLGIAHYSWIPGQARNDKTGMIKAFQATRSPSPVKDPDVIIGESLEPLNPRTLGHFIPSHLEEYQRQQSFTFQSLY